MTDPTVRDEARWSADDDRPDARLDARLGARELSLIAAFWTLFAVLIAANRLIDPRGGVRTSVSLNFAALAFVEAWLWALLTPLIFWMASRFTVQRGHRVARVALYLLAGVAIALLHDALVDAVRGVVLPPSPRFRGPFGGARTFGGFRRLWALNDFVIYMGVLAAGIARDLSLRYRRRHEEAARLQAQAARLGAQLAEARLAALRNQLDPHFLFNTLHAISSLVERDPRGVRRMISRLSELLRFSMEGAAAPEMPLDRELELLARYLEIMQVRFQGRLEVDTQVEPRARQALVPTLVLQPIVENAIKHGAERIEGVARLRVEARVDGPDLVLRVIDNGPGVTTPGTGDRGSPARGSIPTTGDPRSPRPDGAGVGISNTLARLDHMYGADRARFELRSADAGGAVAEIRIPYHTADDLRVAASDARHADETDGAGEVRR